MMTFAFLAIFRTKDSKFKVMIVGRPFGVKDLGTPSSPRVYEWEGCQYRRIALPRSMRREFRSEHEARNYRQLLEKNHKRALIEYALNMRSHGSSYSESEVIPLHAALISK